MDNAGFDKKKKNMGSLIRHRRARVRVHVCVCDAVVGKSKIKIVDVQCFLHDSYKKKC